MPIRVGSKQRLADRAADDNRVEGAFHAAHERRFRGGDRPLLRERAQYVTSHPNTRSDRLILVERNNYSKLRGLVLVRMTITTRKTLLAMTQISTCTYRRLWLRWWLWFGNSQRPRSPKDDGPSLRPCERTILILKLEIKI